MIYVDSNYWIYWLDSRVPEHKKVVRTMRSAVKEGVAMSYVTLFEVAHYFRLLPNDELAELIEAIRKLSTLTLFDLDGRIADLVLINLPANAPKGLSGRDAIILATMSLAGIKRIATHDGALKAVPDIEVVDAIK